MKEAYYFSHDANARHDPKILAMRSVYGTEGYGWYWIVVEMLREQENYKIKIGKYTWNALAMQMQCNADTAHKFVSDCIEEFELLHSDSEYFWSNSLLKRMNKKNEKSEKARKAAAARWGKKAKDKGKNNDSNKENSKENSSNADAMQTHSESNALKESKVKESKEKESKEKKSKEDESKEEASAASEPITFKHVVDKFNNNIHPITPIEAEKLKEWSNDLDCEVIIKAIEEAVFNNGRTINYINAILNSWHSKGINDIHGVEAYLRDRTNKNKGNGNKCGFETNTDKVLDSKESVRRFLEADD